MSQQIGADEARRLMERIQSAGARAAMPPLPVLRAAVAALAQSCEVVLMLMDSVGEGPEEQEEVQQSGGPPIFGR